MTALSTLLKASNPDGLSVRAISAATAKTTAGQLSPAAIATYFNGKHGSPDDRALRALAEVLPVKLSALRQAAGVPVGARGPYNPPDVAHRLSDRQRRAVDELIKSMVDPADAIEEPDTDETDDESKSATIHELPRAARKRPKTEPPKPR